MCEEESVHYLRDLCREKEELEKAGAQNSEVTAKLLAQEISRVQNGGRPPGRENRLLDVYNEKPVRVSARILVPVKEHPRFNFVGKLLGPRGNSLKKLQDDTMTKMAVLGRGSMRNKQHEEEMRSSGDPKHAHLLEELHVEVTAFASPAEAYARLALALSEVRRYLIPDGNDEIRQRQMKEIQILKQLQDRQEDKVEDSGQESDVSASPTSDPSPVLRTTSTSPGPSPSPPAAVDKKSAYDPRSKSILEKIRQHRDGPEDRVREAREVVLVQQDRQSRTGDHQDRTLRTGDHQDCLSSKSILDKILPRHLKERLKRDLEPDHRNIYEEPVWKKIK